MKEIEVDNYTTCEECSSVIDKRKAQKVTERFTQKRIEKPTPETFEDGLSRDVRVYYYCKDHEKNYTHRLIETVNVVEGRDRRYAFMEVNKNGNPKV